MSVEWPSHARMTGAWDFFYFFFKPPKHEKTHGNPRYSINFHLAIPEDDFF